MKTEKLTLTALCVIVFTWIIKMMVGIVNLSHTQDVPAGEAAFELSMFLGAALFPLLAVWFVKGPVTKWLHVLWVPCILYVLFLAFNVSVHGGLLAGWRVLLWAAIIVLFVRVSMKPKQA